MVHTKLIIWDEAPMAHRHCFEALDHTLTDIMHSQNAALAKHPFGGKVVVLGGEGNIGNIINDEEHEITIDGDILIDDAENPIQAIVESTYLKLLDNFKNHVYFRERAILSPKLDDVAQVNEFMLGLLSGEERTYLSSDTICNQDPQDELAEVYTTEFLNTICDSGLPYHQLKLKVGAPIMLLRNIDRSMGL
ncbi:ATP-dependent DNA helicase PIF1-like [Senna tora]|uniref:ATP-dependent DNA helicase n=1 Tax=Senna tora TaxID=362788 RepID=A0A834TU07_9FABA|nr:ATP-dependent DNA helicase PIF1-like [Senna tora]